MRFAGGVGWLRSARMGALVVALGLAGVVMVHYPMIRSGLAAMQPEPGDSQLINYLLEHTYLWVVGANGHRDLWSPPFYYPAPNVAAFSDLMLTIAPPYWAFRGLGLPPDSAFQGWMIAVSVLNYLTLVVLLRRGYHFAWPGTAVGAFLMAFGAPRLNQFTHQQMMPFFFVVAVLYALARLFDEPEPRRWPRWVWWQVVAWGTVAQLYAAFYVGWFLILALGVTAGWGLILPSLRGRVLGVLGRDALPIGLMLVAGGLTLLPFLTHYLSAARELGERDYNLIRLFLLVPGSWLDMGPGSWVAGWAAGSPFFGPGGIPSGERHVGLGVVTPIVCAAGWWLGRDRPLVRVAAPVALTLMVLATTLPGDGIASIGLLVAVVTAARLSHDPDRPALRWLSLGLLGAALVVSRNPTWRETSLAVALMILALVEAGRVVRQRQPSRLIALVLLIGWLGYRVLDSRFVGVALGALAVVVVVVAVVEVLLRPTDRTAIRLGALGLALALACSLTYPDRPEVWAPALLTPLALGLTRLPAWGRPSRGSLVVALLVALGALVLLEGRESLWYLVYEFVPGGRAVRAMGRIALAALVPLAIGAAVFFASPWAARRPVRATLLGLICLVEQGSTMTYFDKAAERDRMAALVRLVDPQARAFYFRPGFTANPLYQIDAMIMSNQSGVPTINGYSGGWPKAWQPLLMIDYYPLMTPVPPGVPTARESLAQWLQAHGMTVDQVQLIGHDFDK